MDQLTQELDGGIVSIVLYGSVARGTATPGSDIDLLVVLEEASNSYFDRLEPVGSIVIRIRNEDCWKDLLDKGFTPEINVLVLSREEADQNRYLYLDMIEDAQILADKGGFFHGRLKKLERRLNELGARRVPIDGNWYWDLKPDLRKGETVTL